MASVHRERRNGKIYYRVYFYDKDKKLRYAIYSDNSGEPGNLITESDEGASPAICET